MMVEQAALVPFVLGPEVMYGGKCLKVFI